MDEIICPECGRPNLAEAEKCWYCQVLLVKSNAEEDQPRESADADSEIPGSENIKSKSSGQEEEEDLPAWLKRIRELKKADTPVEEVDEWQQEKLFTGLAQEKGETAGHPETVKRPARPHEEPDLKSVIPEGQPSLDEIIPEEPSDAHAETENIEPEDAEDELPDGFTPLEH